MIIAGIAALIPAVLITVLALSKKTSPGVKKAATIALVLITLVFMICSLLVVISGPAAGKGGGIVDIPAKPEPQNTANFAAILIMMAILLILLSIVIISSVREQRKK